MSYFYLMEEVIGLQSPKEHQYEFSPTAMFSGVGDGHTAP